MAIMDIRSIDPTPSTKSSLHPIYTASRNDRSLYMARGLRRSSTDFETIFFLYLIQEFEKSPTKTKFAFIYREIFGDQIGRMNYTIDKKRGLNPDTPSTTGDPLGKTYTVDLNFGFTYMNLKLLEEAAATVEELRQIAKSKSFIQRFRSSDSRKIPGYLFNHCVAEITQQRPTDTVAEQYGLNIKSEGAFENLAGIMSGKLDVADSYYKANLKKITGEFAKRLKSAGFDTKALGISGIKSYIHSIKTN